MWPLGCACRACRARKSAGGCDSALEQVNLAGLAHRRVTDLSGGEQQRVALARALAPRPRLLMLDEPLGALDRTLREQLLDELRHLLHATGIPAIYVTHDQEEAFFLADRLLLLHEGLVEQSGSPAEVYAGPASAWAAAFSARPTCSTAAWPLWTRCALKRRWACFPPQPGPGFVPALGAPATLLFPSDGARLVAPGFAEAILTRQRWTILFFAGTVTTWGCACHPGRSFHFRVDHPAQVGERVGLQVLPHRLLALRGPA